MVDPSDLRDARDADPPVPHEPCQHRLQLLPLPLPGGEEEKQHRCSAIEGEQRFNLNTSFLSPEGDGHEEGEDQEPAARQDWILWHHHFRGTLRLLASGLRPEGVLMELLNFGVIFSSLFLRVPLYITYFKLSFCYI